MKTIDLGEKPERLSARPSAKKYYPTIHYSDNGIAGVSSFDEEDIDKQIKVTATIKLTSISSRSDSPSGKHFGYSFEVLNIQMPDDLSKHGGKKK